MKLSCLLKNVDVKKIYNEKDVEITGIHYNSREIEQGNLFVAIRGFSTDGHKYIKSAVNAGAAAIIANEYTEGIDCPQIIVENSRIAEAVVSASFFGEPSKKLRLVGITGTNGKTSCTYLIKHILEFAGYKVGLIGTNQNMIGERVIETGRTTPDSFELQKLFCEMAEEKTDFAVMEISSHALELDRVYGCSFEVGAFTNLTQDHLDFHGNMENYAKAKARLFEMCEFGVINVDDKYGQKIFNNAPCKKIGYGVEESSMLKARNVTLSEDGVSFCLDSGVEYALNIPGKFSVYNCLCAIGVARAIGIDDKKIAKALTLAGGVKGRAEVVKTDKNFTLMIDYAHTPDGIENILQTVRGFAKGRVIILFGCGGDRDNTKRPIMGEVAGRLSDFCIVTSDNPRSEEPMRIINMIIPGIEKTKTPYKVIENRYEAIKYAIENARENDVVVLAGKGHETYQILNSGTIHFDEREVIKEILSGK